MESRSKRVICFGETVWHERDGTAVLGGFAFRLALRLLQLGERPIPVTRLGRDEEGQSAALQMASLGLDLTHLQSDPARPTGRVAVRAQPQGWLERCVEPGESAADGLETTFELLACLQGIDGFCFSILAGRTLAARCTWHRLLELSPSSSLRLLDMDLHTGGYDWETIETGLRLASVIKMSRAEARRLAFGLEIPSDPLPLFSEHLFQRLRLDCCIVTLGEHGAFAMDRGGRAVYDPGHPVEQLDDWGCGEAFTAAFVHQHLGGNSLEECLAFANGYASVAATHPDPMESIDLELVRTLHSLGAPRTVDTRLREWMRHP